jgi:hypothetical protein
VVRYHTSDENIVTPKEKAKMKKLMTAILGLSLLTGLATVSFAQDKKDDTKKEHKKKKAKKAKKDEKQS